MTDAKLGGLELNNLKQIIRSAIGGQILAAARKGILRKEGSFHVGASLPGDRFMFESQMHGMGLTHGLDFRFDCAEISRPRFEEALRHKPRFCGLALMDFHNLLNGKVEYDDAGVAKRLVDPDEIIELWGDYASHYAFVWADYCCAVKPPIIDALSGFASEYNNGRDTLLLYATFSVPRGVHAKSSSHYEDIDRAFLAGLREFTNCKVRQVLSAKYSGGSDYFSHMYTLGFAVGVNAHKVTPVTLDLRRYDGDQHAYYQGLAYRREQSTSGKTDYCLSFKRPLVQGKAWLERLERLARSKKAAKAGMSFVSHKATREEKDHIAEMAACILKKRPCLSAAVLNMRTLEAVNERFPLVTIRNVSATVSTNVTHRETFNKAAKSRRVA